MALRSLCRLGRVITSKFNSKTFSYTQSSFFLSSQDRLLFANHARFFSTHLNTIESLQTRVAQLEIQGNYDLNLVELYDELFMAYQRMGDLATAATIFEKTVKMLEKEKQNNLNKLESRYINLGFMYLELKDAENSLKAFQKSLNLAKEMHGDNSREVAIALNSLSIAYKLNNNIEKSNECSDLALPYMERNINSNDDQVGSYFFTRGNELASQKKINESIDCLNKGRKIIERIYGLISPEVAQLDHQMALIYWDFGKVIECKEAFERAIHIKKSLKMFDDSLIDLYRWLGYLYKRIGNTEKSEEIIEEGSEAVKKMPNNAKNFLAIYYNFVGFDFRLLGEFEASKKWLCKSLEIFNHQEIENTNEMGLCYQNFATYAYDTMDIDKAIEYGQKALEIKRTIRSSPSEISTSLTAIGSFYTLKGDFSIAESYLNEAKKLLETENVNDATALEFCLRSLAYLYRDQGKDAEALVTFQNVFEIAKRAYGEIHGTFGEIHFNIGLLYEKSNRVQEAIEEYKKSITMLLKTYGREYPKTYQYMYHLGTLYRNIGRPQEAAEYHKNALEIQKSLFGENNDQVGISYSELAADYRDMQYYDKALEYHNKAINVYKQCYDSNKDFETHYWGEFVRLGDTYEIKGDKIQALQNYTKVKDFYTGAYGENHEHVSQIQLLIDKVVGA